MTGKKALQWACKHLKSLGYTLTTDLPENVQHSYWSIVVRFETTDGSIYLKQTPQQLSLEAKIIRLLQEQFDAPTPIIIASNDDLNCFLMKDAGKSLRVILKEKFDTNLVCQAVNQFTSLQITVSYNIDKLLNIGLPDWRLNNLPDLYKDVIADKGLLLADGLSEKELCQLDGLVSKISNLCRQLSSYSIRQTLVQPDFNDNNTLINEGSNKITVIDLGEIAISHPFFSLINFLYIIKKHHALKEEDEAYIQIKQACLKPFLIFGTKESISEAFSYAQDLWYIYAVLAHYRLMLACGKEAIMSWQKGKLSSLFRSFMLV